MFGLALDFRFLLPFVLSALSVAGVALIEDGSGDTGGGCVIVSVS
jgi:hypothetical protein